MGYDSTFKADVTFSDKAEEIPDGYIIQREIEKAVTGKPFFYNDETGKAVYQDAVSSKEFFHYYLIWEDFHYLHVLPHGKGTLHERRWLLELLKIFEKASKQVEHLVELKMSRKING